jgi:hypothetical protein
MHTFITLASTRWLPSNESAEMAVRKVEGHHSTLHNRNFGCFVQFRRKFRKFFLVSQGNPEKVVGKAHDGAVPV